MARFVITIDVEASEVSGNFIAMEPDGAGPGCGYISQGGSPRTALANLFEALALMVHEAPDAQHADDVMRWTKPPPTEVKSSIDLSPIEEEIEGLRKRVQVGHELLGDTRDPGVRARIHAKTSTYAHAAELLTAALKRAKSS